jgi:sirohydrochlorin ferrochelatase
MESCYLLLNSGLNRPEEKKAFRELGAGFQKILKGKGVQTVFLSKGAGPVVKAFEKAVGEGARRFVVLPFLTRNKKRFLTQIPQAVADVRMKYPDIDIHYGSSIASDPLITDFISTRTFIRRRK